MPEDETTTRLLQALAPRLGLTIDPVHLPGVAANFDLLARMAAIVESAVDEPDEPATVFRA